MEKPEPSKPIPIPKLPDKPKSKAGRKKLVKPRMTIVQTPVTMDFS